MKATIDFKKAERLVQAESKRRDILFEKAGRKIFWFATAGATLLFIFL